MAFETGVVREDWISAVIVPLYKGKGERIEYSNCRYISLLSVHRICRVTGGLIDDEQGGSRADR